MYHAFTSATTPSTHEPTLKERVRAARYLGRDAAEAVVDDHTDIPFEDWGAYDHAVEAVRAYASDIQARECYAFVFDGLTVAEQLAILAVESVNEAISEAFAS